MTFHGFSKLLCNSVHNGDKVATFHLSSLSILGTKTEVLREGKSKFHFFGCMAELDVNSLRRCFSDEWVDCSYPVKWIFLEFLLNLVR